MIVYWIVDCFFKGLIYCRLIFNILGYDLGKVIYVIINQFEVALFVQEDFPSRGFRILWGVSIESMETMLLSLSPGRMLMFCKKVLY